MGINSKLPSTQHGFRSQRETDTAITVIHETIAYHISRKFFFYLFQRDMSKAFDKVWHKGMHFEIINLKMPDTFTKFLNTLINTRKARIKVVLYIRPTFPLEIGIPQGSSISLTLFTIYTAYLPDPALNCINTQFADDILQILAYGGRSRYLMANRTIQETEKIKKI